MTNAAGEAVRGQLTLGAVDNTEDQFGGLGWTYSVEDGALDDLSEGETRVETFTVALDDGNGGTADPRVVITITGTDDVATLESSTDKTFTESDATQSTGGTLTLSDDDATAATVVAQTDAAGTYGTFSIDAAGVWTYDMAANDALDAGQVVTDTFTVETSDGGSSTVTVTITGTDDVRRSSLLRTRPLLKAMRPRVRVVR